MLCWWPSSCVWQYPLPFPCLQPLQGYVVLFVYLLAAALMLLCRSWVPHRKAEPQVSLVVCPDVVPSARTCRGSWLKPQGIYSCCASRTSYSYPLLLLPLASLAETFVETSEVWGVEWLEAVEWAYIPCHQSGFHGQLFWRGRQPWCPEGMQKYLPGKHLVPEGTKATGPADGPLKPALLFCVYPREDALQHGKAHQHELGGNTLFILAKSGGNEISYPMQKPIKISCCITIYCLYATSIFHEVFKLERWY